jgi:hypothetical protein
MTPSRSAGPAFLSVTYAACGTRANQFFTLGEISFNPEPTATANFPRFNAVAVGSGLNERKTDRPCSRQTKTSALPYCRFTATENGNADSSGLAHGWVPTRMAFPREKDE